MTSEESDAIDVRTQAAKIMVSTPLILLCLAIFGVAQDEKDGWQRVFTEAGNYVDVSVASLVLEPNGVFSAKFRTTLSKPENVDVKAGAKYKTRIDIIQFDSKKSNYRIAESGLLDSSGKVVSSYSAASSEGWKQMKSPTATQLYGAVLTLPPFGSWRVLSYRRADGEPSADDESLELQKLVGGEISLSFYQVQIAREGCSKPMFESRTITNEEFTRLTTSSLKIWDMSTDKVETIVMRCESTTSFSPQSLILKLPNGGLLMFWNGGFLQLEKIRNSSFRLPLVIK